MGQLKEDLASEGAERVETHTAWVFLGVDSAFKVKKPVNFGFLDFTSLDKRRAACEAEVRLNARLAPDVYRGVVPIHRDASGRHHLGGSGELVDYAVEMKRLSDTSRADLLLESGKFGEREVEQLAACLARFHESMPFGAEIAHYGTPAVLSDLLRENFEQTRTSITEYVSAAEANEIAERQLGFLEARKDLFALRVLSGRVRDGHGDLRLEHVYFDQGESPTIIDCIEFNDRFRFADVCSDVAFLSMDLARWGRVDLAERLLATYAREANDYDFYPLVDFYEGYRAFVRAKVASMLQSDTGAPFEIREEGRQSARRHYLLALSSGRRALLEPAVIAVGGVIGAGKSTVAESIAAQLSAPVVGSDRTRKHLLGLEPSAPVEEQAFAGAYAPKFSARVYSEVLRRAASVVSSGRPVVIDASFRGRELRSRARLLASSYEVPFWFVECRAPRELCRQRLERRAEQSSISDARAGLLDDFMSRWEAVEEISSDEYLVLDTSRPIEHSEAELRARLPGWPRRLTQ